MKTTFVSLLMILLLASCGDDDMEDVCFSFDERQCQTDLWAESLSSNASVQNKMDEIEDYFDREGIDIEDIVVDSTFHDAVCEACHVCPFGPRFFIKVENVTEEDLARFDLLNLESVDCSLMF